MGLDRINRIFGISYLHFQFPDEIENMQSLREGGRKAGDQRTEVRGLMQNRLFTTPVKPKFTDFSLGRFSVTHEFRCCVLFRFQP